MASSTSLIGFLTNQALLAEKAAATQLIRLAKSNSTRAERRTEGLPICATASLLHYRNG